MFFIILGTYTRWTFVIFSLVQRILLLIFQCHTVTHGTDLRRSPLAATTLIIPEILACHSIRSISVIYPFPMDLPLPGHVNNEAVLSRGIFANLVLLHSGFNIQMQTCALC